MKKLTILFFLLQFSIAYTQNSQQEIDSLLSLADRGMINTDIESMISNGTIALTKSKNLNYSLGRAKANYYIANGLFAVGEYKKSLDFLNDALEEDYTNSNPTILAEIYRVRGRIYGNLQMDRLAIREFKKAIEVSEKVVVERNKKYLQNLYNENMSYIYFKLNKLDSARYYLDKNKKLFLSQKEDFVFNNKINYYTSLAEILIEKKQHDSAIWNLTQALGLAKKYQYPYKSTIYRNWGDIYRNSINKDSAIFYYKKAIENIKETGIENELPVVYEGLVEVYRELNDDKQYRHYSIELINTKEKLLNEKMRAGDAALKILLAETKNDQPKVNYILLAILSLSTLILSVIIIYLIRRYKRAKIRMTNNKQIIAEKDNLISQKVLETQELKIKLNESFEEVVQLAKDNHPEFIVRFKEVYPEFYEKLSLIEPKLIKSEIKFCALLYLNFSTKDIAQYTFVTVKAVQHSRFRLRKKLQIPSDADIVEWISEKY